MNNFHYSSLGRRIVATLLDVLVLIVPCSLASMILPYFGGAIVWVLYAPILESSSWRATLGKHWMGIQVVDLQGNRISFGSSLLRNLLKALSPALLFFGCVIAFFRENRQTLHDTLASSLVIYGRSEEGLTPVWTTAVKGTFAGVKEGVTGLAVPSFSTADKYEELEKLYSLFQKGAITQDEYDTQKRIILGK